MMWTSYWESTKLLPDTMASINDFYYYCSFIHYKPPIIYLFPFGFNFIC